MNANGLRTLCLLAAILPLSAEALSSQCKTLTQPDCLASASCTWVDSYKRSDGRKVAAYCRTVPKKKSASSTAGKSMPDAG
jgi:hypothetical protein